MTSHFSLFMAGRSDTGRRRDHNEDCIVWDDVHGLALLADGMGGHNAGDVASRMSVETLEEQLLPPLDAPQPPPTEGALSGHAALLRHAVEAANQRVFVAGGHDPARQGMGSTVVALLFYDDRVVVAHVGDSRAYRLHGRELAAITEDHYLVRQLQAEGMMDAEEARLSPYSHVITQAVGVRDTVDVEVNEFDACAGDVYLLCSDGLTDLVPDAAIADTLLAAQGNWDRAAQHLVDLANQAGGRDNISVVIVGVGPRRAGAAASNASHA